MSSAVKIAAGLAFAAMLVEVTRELKAVAPLLCESPYDSLYDSSAAVEHFATRATTRTSPGIESQFDRPSGLVEPSLIAA